MMASDEWQPFSIDEVRNDSAVRLELRGELDLGASSRLREHFRQLAAKGEAVELDLSNLTFVDSSGVAAVLGCVKDAQANGWTLTVDRQLSPQVQHLVELLMLEPILWPDAQG